VVYRTIIYIHRYTWGLRGNIIIIKFILGIDCCLFCILCYLFAFLLFSLFAQVLNFYAFNQFFYKTFKYINYYECGPKQLTATTLSFVPACIFLFSFFLIYDLEVLYLLYYTLSFSFLTTTGLISFLFNIILLLGYFFFELYTNNLTFYL